MAVTVKDVAAEVGMNHATVSRALSGKPQVAEATRRRILKAAQRLGYRPSTAARAVRTGRTGLIGIIHSATSGCSVRVPYFSIAIDQALHATGLCAVRDLVDELPGKDSQRDLSPRILRERVVDGLLINYVLGTPPEVREAIERWRIPAIWINRKRQENCVRPDDEGGALLATRKLIEAGHRRITMCMVFSPGKVHQVEPHYSVHDRRAGYCRAMREAGLKPDVMEITVGIGEERRNSILRGSVRLLSRPDRPTAVLCHTYGSVMVAAAWKLGLDIPRDLSVMTFDDDEISDNQIAIDRVLIPYGEMARAAVRELLALIDDPGKPRTPVVLPLTPEAMGTVGPPARSNP